MSKTIDYETDLYAWALHHAELLRQGRFAELDVEHLIEELESMGKNNQRELVSCLKILLAHLLKWQYQPTYRGRSWQRSIDEQRIQIKDLLIANSSLTSQLVLAITNAYPDAVKLAMKETKIPQTHFPQKCSYSIEQLFDEEFYPSN